MCLKRNIRNNEKERKPQRTARVAKLAKEAVRCGNGILDEEEALEHLYTAGRVGGRVQ